MSDLASNSASLRLIMTTRTKLSEWSDALLAAAAAATASPAGAAVVFTIPRAKDPYAQAAGEAGAATEAAALPLAPWTWPFSSNCGCRGIINSSSKAGKGSTSTGAPSGAPSASSSAAVMVSSGTAQLLRAQRPALQTCLQELSNSAASVHRRVMIWIKSLEEAV